MCKRFDDWSQEIKEFCDSNGYSFEKAKKLGITILSEDEFLKLIS